MSPSRLRISGVAHVDGRGLLEGGERHPHVPLASGDPPELEVNRRPVGRAARGREHALQQRARVVEPAGGGERDGEGHGQLGVVGRGRRRALERGDRASRRARPRRGTADAPRARSRTSSSRPVRKAVVSVSSTASGSQARGRAVELGQQRAHLGGGGLALEHPLEAGHRAVAAVAGEVGARQAEGDRGRLPLVGHGQPPVEPAGGGLGVPLLHAEAAERVQRGRGGGQRRRALVPPDGARPIAERILGEPRHAGPEPRGRLGVALILDPGGLLLEHVAELAVRAAWR